MDDTVEDARSAGERARGFASRPYELVSPENCVRYRAGIQVARVSGRSNALGYGRAGMHGGSLYDAKGLRPLGLPPGHANWFPLETTCATAQAFWL